MLLLRTLLSKELFELGLRDLRAHKLRSFLTALGMIFGVGAVICMLSIGEGASAQQLEEIRLLGSENILLRSIEPPSSTEAGEGGSLRKYGITRLDVERFRELPHVRDVVLMRDIGGTATRGSRKFEGAVLGVSPNLFNVVNLRIARGRPLTPMDDAAGAKVCVIGADVARTLFGHEDPLGQTVNVASPSTGQIPYHVVGVLADVVTSATSKKGGKGGSARNVNRDLIIPLQTADLRYGDLYVKRSGASRDIRKVEYSDAIVRASNTDRVMDVSALVLRVLQHGHKAIDYTITVPLELLRQAEQLKRTSQIVLGSIACISLLVGGIGIMNIMLASVTERTREIGIRRALGAKKHHITAQFLVETVILSVSGGIIGIILGISLAWLVTWFVEWQTIVPWWGVIVSFMVSAIVGISFGLYPARSAASLDPIEALRHE
jgi:putative ABC transport system permease protein